MATALFANLETLTAPPLLLQRSLLCISEPASSSVAVSWRPRMAGALRTVRSRRVHVSAVSTSYKTLDNEFREEEASTSDELLCCPICFKPLSRDGPKGLSLDALRSSRFSCKSCRKGYVNEDVYLDLTILEGSKVYDESTTPGSEIFRSPLVSFLYERGWRSSFAFANFPGPDEEFKMAQDYLRPAAGGVLIDVSCGSGLFTRRFAQSGGYNSVIALDFSENMLRESYQFIKQDASLTTSDIALVRADVARLPFATGSIDAVHAGAALHCWPSPAAAMAEISRILKPGGVFVGTTFINPIPVIDFGIKDIRKAIKRTLDGASVHYWEEAELEELCGVCGLVEYSCIQRGLFIMVSAKRAQD